MNQTRLQRIRSVKEDRLKMPIGSPYRMDIICCQIPDEIPTQSFDSFGYHRGCYQRFTANLHHLEQQGATEPEDPQRKRPKRDPVEGKQVIFPKQCIFQWSGQQRCKSTVRKKVKVKGSVTSEGLCVFDRGGGERLQEVANERKDEELLLKIRHVDLFACEAMYHRSCTQAYIRNYARASTSRETEGKSESTREYHQMVEAHSFAFKEVCKVIDREVFHFALYHDKY
ncbi:uncharacterized protein LOC119734142 [Patiria miniata]|nr:uncharacterized protein LOC119734142 [Patiria miniata]